jgi:hypothetical protein
LAEQRLAAGGAQRSPDPEPTRRLLLSLAQRSPDPEHLRRLEEHELAAYDVVDEARGLLSMGDIAKIGAMVSPNSSAVLMVVEHAWTTHLEQAVLAASGRMVVHERVATEVARAAMEHDRASRASRCGGGYRRRSISIDAYWLNLAS